MKYAIALALLRNLKKGTIATVRNLTFQVISLVSATVLLTAGAEDASARPKPPEPFPTTVNCDAGESIMDAIANGYTIITVAGECDEQVLISIDRITLLSDGANPGSIVASTGIPVNIGGADGVFIDGLTIEAVSGPYGIITSHAQALIQDVDLIGGTVTALAVRNNSTISFGAGGTISGATNGATVFSSSSLSISNAVISAVNNVGVIATGASYLALFNTIVDGSAVADDIRGVAANNGSTVRITNGAISDFGDAGVTAENSSIRIEGAIIEGNGNVATPDYPGDGGVIIAAGSNVFIERGAVIKNNDGYGLAVIEGSGGACRSADIEANTTNLFVDAGSGLGQTSACTLIP